LEWWREVILYPVKDRTAGTLIPIIERHVEKGSTIYSDGFYAYFHLNDIGYRHFTVIQKYSFKKTYQNAETGEIEVVHTNRIMQRITSGKCLAQRHLSGKVTWPK
jgi:transposase-like protein